VPDSDDVPVIDGLLARRGRMFRLRLIRNQAARSEALASIRQTPKGWQARLGGRMRGRTETFGTKAAAERAVNDHYNEAALAGAIAVNRRGEWRNGE
jgi:hypothetical protein